MNRESMKENRNKEKNSFKKAKKTNNTNNSMKTLK